MHHNFTNLFSIIEIKLKLQEEAPIKMHSINFSQDGQMEMFMLKAQAPSWRVQGLAESFLKALQNR